MSHPVSTEESCAYLSIEPASRLTVPAHLYARSVARIGVFILILVSMAATLACSGVIVPRSVLISAVPAHDDAAVGNSVTPGIKGVSFKPSTVVGGGHTTGTVALTSSTAAGALVVTLSSDNPCVKVPSSLRIPAGKASATFAVTTSPISADASVVVTARCQGASNAATLKLFAVGAVSFKDPVIYKVPWANDNVTAVDMDGDGHIDVLDAGAQQIGVLYGKGNGSLEPYKAIYKSANNLYVGGAADLDGDGLPDIVAIQGDRDNARIMVMLNKGKRKFGSPITFREPNAIHIAIADFNHDGKPDLAVVCSAPYAYNGYVQIWLNKGGGKFSPASRLNLDDGCPQYVFAGALKGSVYPVVLASVATSVLETSGVAVFYSKGNGAFKTGPYIDTCTGSVGHACIADLNGDGIPDIVQANWTEYTVSVMYGNGDGTFQDPVSFHCGGIGGGVKAADVVGDGTLALLVACAGSTHISVLPNVKGRFPDFVPLETGGSDIRTLDVGDFNEDGKPDIVTQGGRSGSISILINNRP